MTLIPEQAIQIAADSIEKLRKPDVYRVFDQNPPEHHKAIADYIHDHRPDLCEEVAGVLNELGTVQTGDDSKTAKEHFLLQVWGDVEPEVAGRFPTDDQLLEEARKVRADDPEDLPDGLYRIIIDWDKRKIEVASFSGAELM